MGDFFYQATVYLTAAVLAVPIASRLGLGSVLGYLLAGIVIGPVLHLVGSETQDVQHFAEFGVVMMLFLIGLELEPKALWDMRGKLIGLGGMQVLLTMGAIAGLCLAGGFELSVSLTIGMIFALSSTAIVLQTLNEKGLMKTQGGKSSFSVLLTQDIAVIPMLALLPLLALPIVAELPEAGMQLNDSGVIERTDDGHHDDGHGHGVALSLVDGLPGWQVTLITLAAIATIILVGQFLTRPLFHFIHMAKLRELYTATALLIVISIAFLMTLVGLSPALGTFLAGVILANSEFRHELEADIEPFKGLLLGLFFITVGAGINFAVLADAPVTIVGLTLGVMALKAAVLVVLAIVFKIKGRDRWLFTLGLAQAGEFGFVLISFALQQNALPADLSDEMLLIVALSMLLTPLAFIAYDVLSHRMTDTSGGDAAEPDEIDEQGTVIIAGVGRFGQIVNRMVRMAGIHPIVLDHNMKTVQLMRTFGFKGYFGDPTRPELLHAAGLEDARVLVVSLDDPDSALTLVRYARSKRPDLHIVARAKDRAHVYALYRAGADDIVRELFDSSLRAARYVLENMDYSEFEAAELERTFYRLDRTALKDLAPLWDPEIPAAQNKPFVERAKELNAELETAFLNRASEETEEARTGTDG
ncbi:MAG: cation:proton antiporter [Pseudomonadota bacterium]